MLRPGVPKDRTGGVPNPGHLGGLCSEGIPVDSPSRVQTFFWDEENVRKLERGFAHHHGGLECCQIVHLKWLILCHVDFTSMEIIIKLECRILPAIELPFQTKMQDLLGISCPDTLASLPPRTVTSDLCRTCLVPPRFGNKGYL